MKIINVKSLKNNENIYTKIKQHKLPKLNEIKDFIGLKFKKQETKLAV